MNMYPCLEAYWVTVNPCKSQFPRTMYFIQYIYICRCNHISNHTVHIIILFMDVSSFFLGAKLMSKGRPDT